MNDSPLRLLSKGLRPPFVLRIDLRDVSGFFGDALYLCPDEADYLADFIESHRPRKTPEIEEHEGMGNYSDIGNGRYLVRTQAGFKQALNAWLASQDGDRRSVEFNEGTTFPEAFPSVVSFDWWYRGVYYVTVQHEHVNAFRRRMAEMMRRLDEADPVDQNEPTTDTKGQADE